MAIETKTKDHYSGNCTVILKVENLNDNKPVFGLENYIFGIDENAIQGYCIGSVKVFESFFFKMSKYSM